jgi:hypothetical protein
MEPTAHATTETAGQPAATRPARRDTTMINSVLVDPATFKSVIFMGSEQRKQYVEGGNVPHDEKPQQRDKATGLPVWRCRLDVVPWRGRPEGFTMRVNVVSEHDPADRFIRGQEVELKDMEYGFTPKDEGGGLIIWLRAGGIESVGTTASKSHAVSSVA